MGVILGRTRKLRALRKGDILNINVPYEENTRDYYNGYHPKEIRGKWFTDRFGASSKKRMVIYIGRDGNTMLYLPLTSQSRGGALIHQYMLKDNSMTPHADPDRCSYVEIDSLRAINIPYEMDIPYTGRIAKEDLGNILNRLSNRMPQFESKRDQRGYVPEHLEAAFVTKITRCGYLLEQEIDMKKTYARPTGETISRTKYGMVHYHVPLSMKKVYQMVCEREGHDIQSGPKKAQNRKNGRIVPDNKGEFSQIMV